MSEQSFEEYRPETHKNIYSSYEDGPRYNDYLNDVSGGQKLLIHNNPPLWQRIALAIFSLVLWACILLCFLLAWDYSWSHDLGYTRVILVIVPLVITPFFIFINITFNRKHLKGWNESNTG